MDRILERVEEAIEKLLVELEKNPIKTSVKLFIWYWIAKKIWHEIKR
jgi:hypothetical protein